MHIYVLRIAESGADMGKAKIIYTFEKSDDKIDGAIFIILILPPL